jgi:cytochrome P450
VVEILFSVIKLTGFPIFQTAVSVSTWCASHSADNFKNPDEFIPERWLDDEYKTDNKLASRPFSLGPRGCIGKE